LTRLRIIDRSNSANAPLIWAVRFIPSAGRRRAARSISAPLGGTASNVSGVGTSAGPGSCCGFRAARALSPYNGVMKTHKVGQTFHALGAPIGFLLAFSIVESVLAQDQRGTDTLPFVVKTFLEQLLPLHVHTSTDWWMFGVVLLVGLLQLGVFGIQAWQLRKTVEATQKYAQTAREEMISAHPPNLIVRRIVLKPNIGDATFQLGNALNGCFDVINRGRSKGTITQNHSIIFITDKVLPMTPPRASYPHHP
jgi:hypothetical protein